MQSPALLDPRSVDADVETVSEPEPFAYDRLRYPGLPFDQTHPARLATLAVLHGMEPAAPERCRVLELGCGDGGNLIPLAYQYPDSAFVGIDLSACAIETGRKTVADLGLSNIELRPLDIAAITPDEGRFDYIIAHGVYSWVPEPVREKILSVFRANLAPQGVAFVSYNCYPGSYMRDLSRAIMLFHVRRNPDPKERVQQARLLLQMLAEASNDDIYGYVLKSQHERVRKTLDTVLYHDDLDEGAKAFFLYQVVEAAAQHGLQYLCDSYTPILTGPLMELQREASPIVKFLGQIPEQEWLTREQYWDFARGRMFRDTLLCQKEVGLCRPVAASRIQDLQVCAELVPETADLDPHESGPAEFKTRAGKRITTDHRLGKAALIHLGAIWPRTIGVAELATAALARLGPAAETIEPYLGREVEGLCAILFRSFCAGVVEIEAFPLPLAATVSERPQASLLARRQAETGSLLTNLRHDSVLVEDAVTLRLITLLDGTRTVDQLIRDLAAGRQNGARGDAANAEPIISRENVTSNVQRLAKLALLIA